MTTTILQDTVFTTSLFCSRLRSERERMNLSQEAFAELGGVKRATQLNYESGDRHPDTQYLERLAQSGVDVTYLVSGYRAVPTYNDNQWLRFAPAVLWEIFEIARDIGGSTAEGPTASADSALAAFKALCVAFSRQPTDPANLKQLRERAALFL